MSQNVFKQFLFGLKPVEIKPSRQECDEKITIFNDCLELKLSEYEAKPTKIENILAVENMRRHCYSCKGLNQCLMYYDYFDL